MFGLRGFKVGESTRKLLAAGLIAAFAFGAPGQAMAQANYPDKPIILVVPYEAGGSIDNVARLLSDALAKRLGQPVVLEHRPGGGGIVGSERVSSAAADGYTLMIQNGSLLTALALQELPYTLESFVPVAKLAHANSGLVVHSSVPVNTVAELIALSKEKPGELAASTTAVGASAHLSTELFKAMSGAEIKVVNFRGSAASLTDVVGGHSQIHMTSIINTLPHIEAGTLKLLAQLGAERSALFPDVPTVAETVPGYEHYNWWGIFAPAGTPQPVLDKLTAEIDAVLVEPALIEWFESQGAEVDLLVSAEFSQYLAREYARWVKVVKDANIVAQ